MSIGIAGRFDADYYLSRNTDVAEAAVASGIDAALFAEQHFAAFGQGEGRSPNGYFDADYYLATYSDVAAAAEAAGGDPAGFAYQHFITFGAEEGRNFSQYFDAGFYLAANPDVAASGMDAFEHFMTFGWKEGRDPSAAFDTSEYLAANADVADAGLNPLEHFLAFGQDEGRGAVSVEPPSPPPPPPPPEVIYVELPPEIIHVPTPVDIQTESFGKVDDLLTDGNGHYNFGDGTTPNDGNVIVHNPDSGTELAVAINPRTSAAKFLADNVHTDGAMVTAEYRLPSGAQSTETGSSVDRADRGAFSIIYTVGNTERTIAEHLADGHKIQISFDVDAGEGTDYVVFEAFVAEDGSIDLKNPGTGLLITDNGGNDHSFSNSQQINFFTPDGVDILQPDGDFHVLITDYDAAGNLVAGLDVHLVLGEPSLDGLHLIG